MYALRTVVAAVLTGTAALTVIGPTPAGATTVSDISTIAGSTLGGVAATSTNIGVSGAAYVPGGAGDFYVADTTHGVIWRVSSAGTATVFAGNGATTQFAIATGQVATSFPLSQPSALAVDSAGNVLFAVSGEIVDVVAVAACSSSCPYGLSSMTVGDIYTIAGGGSSTASAVSATSVSLSQPSALAVDAQHNLLISDTQHNLVRVVASSTGTFYGQSMTAGDIYTIAGDGTSGFTGDGAAATLAELNFPQGIALDSAGNVLIADTGNSRVRLVWEASNCSSSCGYGLTSATQGDIYTIAGGGSPTSGNGDGGSATSASLNSPQAIAVDPSGNIAIAESGDVRLVATTTSTFYGQSMTAGDIYTIAGGGSPTSGNGDGGSATAASIGLASGISFGTSGSFLVSDSSNDRVRLVWEASSCSSACSYGLTSATTGDIYTAAGTGVVYGGDGGAATSAQLTAPAGIAVDSHGGTVIADLGDSAIRYLAGSSGSFFGQSMTQGDIYTIAGSNQPGQLPVSSGALATSGSINPYDGVAVDSSGNVIFANDELPSTVQVIAATACSSGCPYGLTSMTVGDIYTIAGGDSTAVTSSGVAATSAQLSLPAAVALDSSGDILISDVGANVVYLLAEHSCSSTCPYGLTSMTVGDIYTIAGGGSPASGVGDGGAALSASLNYPLGLAVDSSGNVIIADTSDLLVRVVAATSGTYYGQSMTAGDIYAIAGGGSTSGNVSGVAPTSVMVDPNGLAVDSAGDLFIADSEVQGVRMIPSTSGTFYGQSMTAGDIYTIAGDGTAGFAGDGGAATSAELNGPQGIALDSSGNVLVTDGGNNRVRLIAQSLASQTISFTSTAPTETYGSTTSYTPTATGGASGNPVTFTIDSSSTSGTCSISSGVVSFVDVGTCVIDANQAGNTNYAAATQVQQDVTVGKGSQTISFTSTAPTNAVVGGATYTPTATGGASGNPVTFTIDSSSSAICSAASGVVTFSAVGTCVIDANQAGNTNYAAATQVQQDVTVAGAPTHLAVVGQPNSTVANGGSLGIVTVVVEDANGNVVTSNTSTVTMTIVSGTGTLTGTTTEAAINGVATFTGVTLSGAAGSFTLGFTDGSLTGATSNSFTLVAVIVSGGGGGGGSSGPATQATLTLTSTSGTVGVPLTLTSSGGSGTGAVTYTLSSAGTAGCSLSAGVVSAASAGTCTVTVTKAADSTYQAASSAPTTITITIRAKVHPFAPRAIRMLGPVWTGRSVLVRILGIDFYGRPTITSDVGGTSVTVDGDTGRILTVRVAVAANVHDGVHTLRIVFAHGQVTTVRYNQRTR